MSTDPAPAGGIFSSGAPAISSPGYSAGSVLFANQMGAPVDDYGSDHVTESFGRLASVVASLLSNLIRLLCVLSASWLILSRSHPRHARTLHLVPKQRQAARRRHDALHRPRIRTGMGPALRWPPVERPDLLPKAVGTIRGWLDRHGF
jgi:hypothetical protein